MTDPRLLRFAERLRQTRLAAGLTIADVSRAVEINESYLSYIERGLRLPGLDVVYKLADALDVTVGELLD